MFLQNHGKVRNVSNPSHIMSTNNLSQPYQSDYKPNHGTETLDHRLKNDIFCALDDKKAVCLVLLDLSAVFDTCTFDFDILNQRLSNSLGIKRSVRTNFIVSSSSDVTGGGAGGRVPSQRLLTGKFLLTHREKRGKEKREKG